MAVELSAALEASLATAGTGWARVEAVVRSVFRLAARRPELLGLVREMGRLGNPAATRLVTALDPMVRRASEFLEAEMDAGHMRRHEPRLLLLAIYSTVIGMVTEVEVLRAFGEEAHRPVAGPASRRDPGAAPLGAGHRPRVRPGPGRYSLAWAALRSCRVGLGGGGGGRLGVNRLFASGVTGPFLDAADLPLAAGPAVAVRPGEERPASGR